MKVLTQAEILAEVHAAARVRREHVSACLAEINAAGASAEAVSGALARHLARTKPADLPEAARALWLEKIARPLKCGAGQPLTPRALAAIRSWPSARIEDLVAALGNFERLLLEAENDAHNEVFYAEISRAYS